MIVHNTYLLLHNREEIERPNRRTPKADYNN